MGQKPLTPPARLAWSSSDNKIDIVELKTKKMYASFYGVSVVKNDQSTADWTHVKEIQNTGLIVSVHHHYDTCANLAVFDVSRKGKARKIYSFEQVSGDAGHGDVTYNPRRSILGALPVGEETAYHLFNISTSKGDNIVKLIRKSKWPSQHSYYRNSITGIDFSPTGDLVATADRNGVCLISDINTGRSVFYQIMMMTLVSDSSSRCKWSPNSDDPIVFLRYDGTKLNILDVEKKTRTLKDPVELGDTYWIDVCQSNGNLLVSGGNYTDLKIFDKRRANIVQSFDNILTDYPNDWINCVRWNPSGDMLATASQDKIITLLDFKTGKKLYTGKTSDGNPASSICFL